MEKCAWLSVGGGGGGGELQSPEIFVGAFGARQEWSGRMRAEKLGGGVGVDRPSVRTDERCYTNKRVWDGVRRGEVCCDGRSVGKMEVAAGCDRNHRTVGDHEVGRRNRRRFEYAGERTGELRMQQNA